MLRVEGGRIFHSWCMCVVVMAMVGWMGAGMEFVLDKHAGQSQVVGRMSRDAGAFPVCVGAVLGRVEPELVGLPGKTYHGTPREGFGSSSMQPVGCTPWCSTDATSTSDNNTEV